MKYVISGASAQIAQLVIPKLLREISTDELTLISRNPASLKKWSDKGVEVLAGHHGDPESLKVGFSDADALLMISSLAVGHRIEHHRNTIAVAKKANVKHITYTGVAGTHPSNNTPSAKEHLVTEQLLQDSGINFTVLRNQLYSEMLYSMIENEAIKTGGRWVLNSAEGGFAPVSRNDIAECAAAIMLAPQKHTKVIYEITGNERFTFPSLAVLAETLWQTSIDYVPVSDQDMYKIYEDIGIPKEGDPTHTIVPFIFGSEELVEQFNAYEMGLLDIQSGHVEYITGKKPALLKDILTNMIQSAA